MGLLDALKQYVSDSMPGGLLNPEWNKANGQRLAEELNRGLLESTGINARDKRRAWERNKLDAVSGSSDTKASLNQQAYDSAMAMAGMAPMGLTVWHGSPHKFSKFDMSKIGTGEGAQAYGHGLYMAESPVVATEYQQSVSNAKAPELYRARATLKAAQKDVDQITSWLDGSSPWPNNTQGKPVSREFLEKRLAEYQGDLKWANDVVANRTESGQLYKVDIPDEAVARMLDWDKKIADQIPEVQAVAKQWNNGTLPTGITSGDELLRYIQQQLGFIGSPKKAEQILKEAGVPGIKYLDGGSRSAGQGSRNYVLFDDQMPRIIEVNGQETGLQPWQQGEWKGLLGN